MIAYRIWQVAGWTMLHYLWVGGGLGTAVLALRWGLRLAEANVRYFAALAGLALMTAAPALIAVYVVHDLSPLPNNPSPSPGVEQYAEGRAAASPAAPLADHRPAIEPAAPAPLPAGPAPAAAPPPRGASRPATVFAPILEAAARYLPWLWIVGAPFALLLTTAGMVGAERLRRQSRPAEDAAIAELCGRLAASLKLSCRVGVAVCDRITGPILVGIVRPVVLLPAVALTGWDPQQLEMVLLHELVHVRRWDNLVNLVQRIVESVLFFHPMIWVVSAWVRREREHCCDAAVVAHTRQPRAYAQLLVALAEQVSSGSLATSPLACPQVASSMAQRPLVARIRRILKKEEQSMQVSRKTIAVVLVGLLGIAGVVGAYCSQPSRAADAPEKPKPDAAKQAVGMAREDTAEYIARAKAHLEKREYDKAISDCDKAVSLDPKFAMAYVVRAYAESSAGDLDKAIADCDRAVALDPKLAEAYMRRGSAWLEKREFDKALADSSKALALDPGLWEMHLNLGTAWLEKGNREKAVAEYKQALASAPNDPRAINNLGVCDWKLAQDEDRKAAFAEGAGDEKTAASCRQKAAELKKEARSLWLRGVAARPTSADICSNLGYAYSEANDLEHAELYLKQAVELKPNSPRPHNNLGRVLLRRSQERDAAGREAAAKSKTDLEAATKAASLHDEAKSLLDRAIGQFEKAVELDPSLFEARLNLGTVYYRLNDFGKAEAQYRAILKFQPQKFEDSEEKANFSQANFGLARIAVARKQSDEAVRDLRQAIELNPNNTSAWQLLAVQRYERGEYAEGDKCVQSWLAKLQPRAPKLVAQRAEEFAKQLDDAGHHEAAGKARAAATLPAEKAAKANEATDNKPSAAKPADKASPDKDKLSEQWTAAEQRFPPGTLLGLPAYRYLASPDVRKHYGIDAAQEKKLRDISTEYFAAQRKDSQAYKESQKLPPQERQAKQKELGTKFQQTTDSSRKQIEDVLTAAQKAAYRLDLCGNVALGLSTDTEQTAKSLGIDLSDQQKQQLERLKDEGNENRNKRIAETDKRLLAVLTPQQRERLDARFTDAVVAAPDVYVPPVEAAGSNMVPGLYAGASPPRPFTFLFNSDGGASVHAYAELADATVRKELALTAEQEAKLRAIQAKSQAAAQKLFERYEPKAGPPKLSTEEQKKQRAAYEQALKTFGKDVVAQIDAVLEPRQVAALKAIARKYKAIETLMGQDRAVLDGLHATDEQRAKLRQICIEFATPDFSLHSATGDKALGILTPEQRKKLDEAMQRYGW